MFWFFIIISLACGYLRIKRERHTFHTKIADMYDELIFTYIKGLIPGILLSILFFGLGISIPFGLLGIIAAVTALASLTFRMNWLSSAYIVSAGMFIVFVLQYTHTLPFADRFPQAFGVNWASAAVFMGLLIITEGPLLTVQRLKKHLRRLSSAAEVCPSAVNWRIAHGCFRFSYWCRAAGLKHTFLGGLSLPCRAALSI